MADEDDAWVLGLLLRALGRADPQRSKGLMDSFEPEFFVRIAESEEDVNKLGMLFSGMKTAHLEYTTPLISKTVGKLDFEGAHHRHMEHAFSSMNPQAMAQAGWAAQRAEDRAKAISSFTSFYPPEKFLAAVHNLGEKLAEDSKPEEPSMFLFTHRLKLDLLPSEIIWRAYLYEPDYCLMLLQNGVWHPVAQGCEVERTFTQKCKLAIALRSANPRRFIEWVSRHPDVSVASFSLRDLSEGLSLSAEHDSAAGFLLYSATTARDKSSIDELLNSAKLHEVNNVVALLSNYDVNLASEILAQASYATVERFVKTGSEWEAEAFIGLVYQIAPDQAGTIPKGAFKVYENGEHRPVSNIHGNLPAICEVLRQLNSRWLFNTSATRKLDGNGRFRFARALEAMGSVSAIHANQDLDQIGRCLSSITDCDRVTGKAIVASLDLDVLREKIRRSKDPSPWFFGAIAKANPDVANQLSEVIIDKARKVGSTSSIAIIERVYDSDKCLGRELLGQIGSHELAAWCCQGRDVEDVAKSFSTAARLDPARKAILNESTTGRLKKMVSREGHLWTVLRALKHFTEVDVEVGKILAAEIPKNALKQTLEENDLGLITGNYGRDGIADLAALIPERVMACREILLTKIYELDPNEYPGYERAEKLFEQLRQKSPQVLQHFIRGLDVKRLVNLVSNENRKKQSWYKPNIYGFFEELYRADKALAKELQAQCPDRISEGRLDDLAEDFP